MLFRFCVFLLIFLSLGACNKDTELPFLTGEWAVVGTSGGFTGLGYDPSFDLLIIDSSSNFELRDKGLSVLKGKIEVINKEDNEVQFIADDPNLSNSIPLLKEEKIAVLRGDQLFLEGPCCDRFNIQLRRVE